VVVPQCSDQPEHHEWAHWVGNTEDMPFVGLGADGSYEQHADPWPSAQAVRELVDALQAEVTIEPDRIFLTGESMGGFGTWEFTTRWPDVFATGVPMAGFSDRTKVDLILHIPFWVFHGDADTSNPVEGSRAMVEAINAAGGSARYTEYAGTGHGETFSRAWTEEPELQPWIHSQRRYP
jgi:predicted peptidase